MGLRIKQAAWLWIYLGLAAGLLGLYLLAAAIAGESGFPLDDAWIHQTYARSLAQSGRWEYVPGQASAGSTAPFWTICLALGYWLNLPYHGWTLGLGIILLALAGRLAHHLAEELFPDQTWAGPLVGLLMVSEWHLLWAAASGMETVLFVTLSLALLVVCVNIERENDVPKLSKYWVALGGLGALLVLNRPEGGLLLALLGLWLIWLAFSQTWPAKRLFLRVLTAAIPFGLLLAPYLAFNLAHSGGLWPNTFYAKQTEYAAELAQPFLQRLFKVVLPSLTGYQILLVPGLIACAIKVARRRPFYLLPLIYPFLHMALYALRLPVVYQHGRYLIPAVPFLLLCGVGGTGSWMRPRHPVLWRRILSRSWMVALLVLAIAFVLLGARAYAKDVQIIESEMVAVAHWLVQNTQPTEWVAAHDIGAIGYFAQRPILDLAGLISPQVVPYMGNEQGLADYILTSQARYLVTAPGWLYTSITQRQGVLQVFNADSPWTAAEGINSSAVYELPKSP